MSGTYWCELALVGSQIRQRVAVTVDDGRFTAIETDVEPTEATPRLAGLTIPGLANAHSHAFHRALRGRTQEVTGSFWTWRELMYRAAERLDPDGYHRLARATFAEMAMAGIAAVGEFHYLHHQPDGTPYDDPNAMGTALVAAAEEAGVRITLLDTLYLHGGLRADGYAEVGGVQRRFSDGTAQAWAERVEALPSTGSARVGAAVHSVRAVDPASLETARHWAAERDAPVHAHVSEQSAENEQCLAHHGTTPTGLLAEAGLLDDRFTAIHATHLAEDDIAGLAASSSRVCLCPTTERDLADGIGPTVELSDAGVAMCLGTDSHAAIDMFAEARAVELDERLRSRRRGSHSVESLVDMATAGGHASLGWDDAGVIAVGNRADLVTIGLDSVRTAGATAHTALATAVFAAGAGDITHVVVDGTTVVTEGRHCRVDAAAELAAVIVGLFDR